jgi:hypothetical protein
MSTIQPDCLPSGTEEGAEAVAYFQQTVALFKVMPRLMHFNLSKLMHRCRAYLLTSGLATRALLLMIRPPILCRISLLLSRLKLYV